MGCFQRNSHARVVGYHSCRVLGSRPYSGDRCAIDPAAVRRQLPDPHHLLSRQSAAFGSVGVKLYSHRIWIEVAEKELNLKYVLSFVRIKCVRFNSEFAEAQLGPFLL